MADETQVYNIKFNTATALKNLKELDKTIDKIEKNTLVKSFANVERKIKDIGRQSQKTGRALDKAFSKNRAKKKIDALKKSADKAAKSVRSIGNSGQGLKTFSQNLNRYAVLPLAALGAASIKSAMDINKSMASVSTLLDEPAGKIEVLKKNIQDLAIESGQSTGDLSEGLYQVISALGESSENLDQLKIASDAAVAGVSSTKDAISLLSAAGKGYNDVSAESLKHTADLAFQTVKLGVTTFPELAASMGKVIPLAAQFGTSQEELFATMATLTGVTGNTAEVTTQLSSVYSAFMQPSEAMDNAFQSINKKHEEYNFQSVSAMVKTLGFKKSIELMNVEAAGSEEVLGKIFKRKEAILGVLPLVTTQSENYTFKLGEMSEAGGANADALAQQTEGINKQGHEWEKTKQRMVVMSQRIGDRMLPVLNRLIDLGEPILQWLEGMDDEAMDNALAWGKLAVSIGLGLKAMEGITSITSGVSNGITSIGSAAGGATGQVGGMAGAVTKLNGALAALAVGAAVGGVIWTLIDHAQNANQKKKNVGTKKSGGAVDVLKNPNASISDIDKAIADVEGKYDRGNISGSQRLSGRANMGANRSEEEISDQLWVEDLKKKRTNKLERQRTGQDLFLFEGEQRETTVPFGDVADPFLGGGQSRQSGGGGGQNININQGNTTINTGADAKSVEAVLNNRDRQTKKALKRAVAEAARG